MLNKDPFHTGIKLRRLREFQSYSQEWAAAELGIAKSTLSDYETGKIVPGQALLIKAAELLNVDPGVFFTREQLHLEPQRHPASREPGLSGGHADNQLLERLIDHLHERDKRLEDLFARMLDAIGRR